jgi:hypothetical protein
LAAFQELVVVLVMQRAAVGPRRGDDGVGLASGALENAAAKKYGLDTAFIVNLLQSTKDQFVGSALWDSIRKYGRVGRDGK